MYWNVSPVDEKELVNRVKEIPGFPFSGLSKCGAFWESNPRESIPVARSKRLLYPSPSESKLSKSNSYAACSVVTDEWLVEPVVNESFF